MVDVLLKIDNQEIPVELIKKLQVEYNKIDGEGNKRNLAGTMRRQVIANKVKLTVELVPMLEENEVQTILSLITKDEAKVEYLDPKIKGLKTIKAYFSAPKVSTPMKDERGLIYDEFSFNIIEM